MLRQRPSPDLEARRPKTFEGAVKRKLKWADLAGSDDNNIDDLEIINAKELSSEYEFRPDVDSGEGVLKSTVGLKVSSRTKIAEPHLRHFGVRRRERQRPQGERRDMSPARAICATNQPAGNCYNLPAACARGSTDPLTRSANKFAPAPRLPAASACQLSTSH